MSEKEYAEAFARNLLYQMERAYRHELEHIAEGDCYSNEKAGGIESARHK